MCFHLLHNGEWRQRVLPRLPHYSGSSVGVRETASLGALPQVGMLLVPTLRTSHYGAKNCQMSDEWRDRVDDEQKPP